MSSIQPRSLAQSYSNGVLPSSLFWGIAPTSSLHLLPPRPPSAGQISRVSSLGGTCVTPSSHHTSTTTFPAPAAISPIHTTSIANVPGISTGYKDTPSPVLPSVPATNPGRNANLPAIVVKAPNRFTMPEQDSLPDSTIACTIDKISGTESEVKSQSIAKKDLPALSSTANLEATLYQFMLTQGMLQEGFGPISTTSPAHLNVTISDDYISDGRHLNRGSEGYLSLPRPGVSFISTLINYSDTGPYIGF
ncbi:unnamed protein product [Protopolystoma xenopodis]|uniref:Uncharacterized protein n=1 Tax=Protopolystoma xenopodis TaxID=117903 RepID=A0A448WAA0_9PLAT|nr:unnamed protein product [Protopolystoma xenopodis]